MGKIVGFIMGRRQILLAVFFCFFCLPANNFAQDARARSADELIIRSATGGPPRYGLAARPHKSTDPQIAAPARGEIYYDDDEKRFRWFDGGNWNTLSSGEQYEVTRIVAAWNSVGSTRDGINPCTGSGGSCINPKADYTCNGSGDMSDISSAISAVGPGGAVYLLEGTYYVDNFQLDISADNVALIGAGKATVIQPKNDCISGHAIRVFGDNVLIARLRIDGNKNNQTIDISGIVFYGSENNRVDKVWVENMSGNGIDIAGGLGVSTRHIMVTNSHISQNVLNGILIEEGADDNIIANNIIVDNSDGTPERDLKIVGSAAGPKWCARNSVYGNVIRDGYGLRLDDYTADNSVRGNQIYSSTEDTVIGVSSGIRNVASANNIQNGDAIADGLVVGWAGGSSILTSNMIVDPGGDCGISATNRVIVSANRIYDSTRYIFLGDPTYGIKLNSGNLEECSIFGNLIDGSALVGADFDTRLYDNTLSKPARFTDKAKISLKRKTILPTGSATLDVSTSPASYIALTNTSAVTIGGFTSGKAPGDLLIIEKAGSSYVIIPHGSAAKTVLKGAANRRLDLRDTLTLTWDGTAWVETSFVNHT